MAEQRIVIIGNRHTEFANNNNILTYDQFNYLLQIESKLVESQNKYQIYFGQGLSDTQIDFLFRKIKRSHLAKRFTFNSVIHQVSRASSQLTHKRRIENCMISEPEKYSDKDFRGYLMLDESCAEMIDHLTGQHIQGMVLIEAARQMVNSVAEKYLISKQTPAKKGFVLNSLESTFIEYIFPLEVELRFKLENIRYGLQGDFKANAIIQFFQNNNIVMLVKIGFSVMDKTILSNIEAQMAELAVNKMIKTPAFRRINQYAA